MRLGAERGEFVFAGYPSGAEALESAYLPENTDKEGWFVEEPSEEYRNCRDSDFGFGNPHINEKVFVLIAKRMADNAVRVLREGGEPLLEKEIISKLIEAESK